MSEDPLYDLYAAALDAMKTVGPGPLATRVEFEAKIHNVEELASDAVLIDHVTNAQIGDRILSRLRLTLATWDADTIASWSQGTEPRTEPRRARIYDLLELSEEMRACFDGAMPVAVDDAVVISDEFKPWFGRVMADRESFYWLHYAEYLVRRGWNEEAIAALDLNTTRVVERLGDPEREDAYQAKGLVVGYVQSGKTANFTGVAARAIDAGYRLIIVLTGTTDLLRGQTQRRLDKELVGYENLMRGIEPEDADALETVDYRTDSDWGDFVRHAALPSTLGFPDVIRLTTHAFDYKSLRQGITSLEFDRIDPALPLNAPVNLHRVPARLTVIKKNKSVMSKLVKDLKRITTRLAEVPALIIDDESDQASINTSNPDKWEEGRTERTAINRLISELLELLPRAQYVGYTATPFANVFVDPSDAIDIFPRDFILSLDRPAGYMGAREFHDLDEWPEDEERTVAKSNEKAYVRSVYDDDAHTALRDALDMFVLTGMVKLFRESAAKTPGRFRHHTMLVHESVKQADHRDLANVIRDLWHNAGFHSSTGVERLRRLFESDLLPVMHARAGGEPVPTTFDDIKPFLGEVTRRIEGPPNDPVLIVNADKEVVVEDVDFERRPLWRVLVGAAKLSRGFTVEGLTVSYYRRVTRQADTLMQMGRWFGFRDGYRDLVRLYIRRATSARGQNAFDLYLAFEASCRSEEMFRAEIRRYAQIEDGVPVIKPAEVPPLVAQHLGWLRPAASNKMYNARLVERRSPGQRLEPVGYPKKPDDLEHNTHTLEPLLKAATNDGVFAYATTSGQRDYRARYGELKHGQLIELLNELRWLPADHFAADLTWLQGLGSEQIEDWIVIFPQHARSGAWSTVLAQGPISVFRRERRRETLFGAISDPKHRSAAGRIAGVGDPLADPLTDRLHRERRGALLVYPMVETSEDEEVPDELQPSEVVMALVFVAPTSTGSPDKALVRFVVHDKTKAHEPIVEAA
jgi:Z1 domain-containing protein